MTLLRKRMIDMTLAGFVPRTQDVYIQAVRRLAAHCMRSPDLLSEAELRAYLLHLRDERGIARGTFKTNHGGDPTGVQHSYAEMALARMFMIAPATKTATTSTRCAALWGETCEQTGEPGHSVPSLSRGTEDRRP